MRHYIAPGWQSVFLRAGLDFDALWGLDLDPLDEPNTGRGKNGWSAVSRFVLERPDGSEEQVIIKRQQNHFSRTIRHPFRGIPTFEKEIINILRYKRAGIPSLDPIYFSRRRAGDGIRAILITKFLEGYIALDDLVRTWVENGWPDRADRLRMIRALAAPVRKLHDAGFQHNCLYPRHLLVRRTGDDIRVKIIDLEKTKRRPLGIERRIRDLESLHRRTGGWSRTDRLRFLMAYAGSDRLDEKTRRLCRRILKRNRKKRASQGSRNDPTP